MNRILLKLRSLLKGRSGMLRVIFASKKGTAGLIILLVFFIIAAFAPLITPYNPYASDFDAWQAPSSKHLLGTTNLGEDIFSQIIYGTRLSFSIAIASSILATVIAIVIGIIAGYKGGFIDRVAMSMSNIFLVLPALPLMIVIAVYIQMKGAVPIITVIALTTWAWDARVFRSQTLSLKEREFIRSAIVIGDSDFRIIFKDLMPNMISLIVSGAVGTALYAVVAEASLEFIGLGDPTAVTWGTMIFWAITSFAQAKEAWWWFIPPAVAIGLLGCGFALLNFAIDEITNPRLQRIR